VRPITAKPPNTGVALEDLNGEPLSQELMFLRCNFPLPSAPPDGFELLVPGAGRRFVTPQVLQTFERVEREIVLECAGNGRTYMRPVPEGTPWDLDAVSPVTVAGYRLADVIGDLAEEVVEVVFTGADTGMVETEGLVSYQFSISREMACSPRPLLVTHIGGAPLDLAHGAPVRLIVPGHYAMKSVKWVVRVEAVNAPFEGHFVKKYRYYGDAQEPEQAPVADLAVRSVIAAPGDGDTIAAGELTIRGSAWSGSSPIAGVEVTVDGGESWIEADLKTRLDETWSAVPWEVTVDAAAGAVVVAARATDRSGAIQPLEPRWNANGYANNVVHRITVTVE
jgi:DMSO/TMAO reductase YedYZ molybdopterin-dependent catalytic subunit